MKTLLLLLSATVGVAACGGVRTVYREWFDHMRDNTECFSPGTTLCEVESGGSKALVFAPQGKGFARRGFFNVEKSPAADEWTVFFSYRFGKEATRKAFDLVLFFGDRGKPQEVRLPVDRGETYMLDGFVTVKSREAALWLYDKGVKKAVARRTLPDGPLVGWNLFGEEGLVAHVTGVRVVDGAARPYGLGDLSEFIAALPPVTNETIAADFGSVLPSDRKMVRLVDAERNAIEIAFKPSTNGTSEIQFRDGARVVKGYSFAFGKWSYPRIYPQTLTNEYIEVRGTDCPYGFPYLFTRPRLNRYEPAEVDEIRAAADRFPMPWEKVWSLELRKTDAGAYGLYIEGNYVTSFTNGPVTAVSAVAAKGAAFAVREKPLKVRPLLEPLDFRAWPGGFPLWRCRANRGAGGLGMYSYPCRSPFEAMPSSCLFTVPNRQYVKARARCRVAEDVPDDFEPVVIARLCAYHKHTADGGRPVRVECKAVLPRKGEKPVPQPGVALRDLGNGVWEVTFDLPSGDIQDMIFMGDPLSNGKHRPYLDFEFVGPLWRQCRTYVDRAIMPDREVRSSVVVLDGELLVAPVEMHALPKHPFSTYYEGEVPSSRVFVDSHCRGEVPVTVTVRDEQGRVVQTEKIVGSGKFDREVVFTNREIGWYEVEYRSSVVHKASYCVVPKDERMADFDSPYYAWTWFGVHGTCNNLEQNLDLLQRMGVRSTMIDSPWLGRQKLDEDSPLARQYKIHLMQFGFGGKMVLRSLKPGQTEEEGIAEKAEQFRELVRRFPHTKRALIFHESGGGPFPQELLGGTTAVTDEQRTVDTNRLTMAVRTAKAWRLADPSVKLVWGNSVWSLPLLASVYREKTPPELIDFTGEETVGCQTPPEMCTAFAPWLQRKLSKVMGYGQVGVDAPFEWKSRVARNFQDPVRQGVDYQIRDMVIALALGYSMVPAPVGPDASNAYFESIWASGGTHLRYPLAYPTRVAPAVATLTAVFDRAKFRGLLPTGSLSAYAPQFAVRDGTRYATAVWCARGETKATLDLGENASYELVATTGRRTKGQTAREIAVTESPRYILTDRPLKGVTVAQTRTYPHDPVLKTKRVAVPLASADEATIAAGDDPRLAGPADRCAVPGAQQTGAFALAGVRDAEKGPCIELTDRTENVPEIMLDCAFMKFPHAQPVEGEYDTIGVWVKGNSSWGKLFFEITDAEGEVWTSTGSGGYDCVIYDTSYQTAFPFDGWHLVTFPLTRESPVRAPNPGMDWLQWTRDGEKGNGRIDFPVKVSGLGVGNYRYALDFLEMRPVSPSLRFKDVMLMRK